MIAAGVALVIACSSSSERPRQAAETAAPSAAEVATQAAAIGTEAYRVLAGRVNIVTLDATLLLNQTGLFIVSNDDARPTHRRSGSWAVGYGDPERVQSRHPHGQL